VNANVILFVDDILFILYTSRSGRPPVEAMGRMLVMSAEFSSLFVECFQWLPDFSQA
jgi:hypothetical protein